MAYLTVRVIPRARKPGIVGVRDGTLVVRLQSPPVEGAANAELVRLIAEALDVPRRSVSIVSGEQTRLKRLRVEGVTTEVANARLKLQERNDTR